MPSKLVGPVAHGLVELLEAEAQVVVDHRLNLVTLPLLRSSIQNVKSTYYLIRVACTRRSSSSLQDL